MATVEAPFYTRTSVEGLTAQDFETASIRSAAPSYVSDAPSYHSTVQNSEPIPAYTPRSTAASTANGSTSSNPSSNLTPHQHHQRVTSVPSLLPSRDSHSAPTRGLPPVPSGPRVGSGAAALPSLASFRIPSLKRVVLERVEEEERVQARLRPLEDPYLVGEEAASRARRERLARENGDDILIREDRRWDFFLAQMNDCEERERSWNRFRRETELKQSRGRLGFGRRLWAR
ncbi:hypothetical protein NKR19_g2077 [Coniochaeta hoffmannii]|uniref:Uncharacterized protein n=1 Tax=Coniochaeta hoffmannii TaxID=91930 RepID=A0AA38RYK0_9PEZI|nr:hypothetical protein NKR19_g2077 [Coniochaeta hoffmannii]